MNTSFFLIYNYPLFFCFLLLSFFFTSFRDIFPVVLAIFLFTGCSKHVLVKLSIVLKVFVLEKLLLAFSLFFRSSFFSKLSFWMVLCIKLLLFCLVLSVELPLQVTNVLVWFTVDLISVSCFIINGFSRLFSVRYSISSLRELM